MAAPRIDVLLDGFAISTDTARMALCEVILIEGTSANGEPVRILVDPAHVGRRTFLVEALASRGLTPANVDMVVLTHGHWDHAENIDVFAHAPLYLHPDERRYCGRPHPNDWATPAWTGDILERMEIHEIADGDELIPGVGVVDLPGHSAGSIGITVQDERGLSLIAGDALHSGPIALTRQLPLIFWNAGQAQSSIDRCLKMADVIYPGHDRPFRLAADGQIEYLRPFSLTITGTLPGRPGLRFDDTPRAPWVMPGLEDQPRRGLAI